MLLSANKGMMVLGIQYDEEGEGDNPTPTVIKRKFDVLGTSDKLREIHESFEGAPSGHFEAEVVKLMISIGYPEPIPLFTASEFAKAVWDKATQLKKALWETPTSAGSPALPVSSDSMDETYPRLMQDSGNG